MNANQKVEMLHNAIAAQVKHEIEKEERIVRFEDVPYTWYVASKDIQFKTNGKRFYTENRVVTVHPRDEETVWIFIGPDVRTVVDESIVNTTELAKVSIEEFYKYND